MGPFQFQAVGELFQRIGFDHDALVDPFLQVTVGSHAHRVNHDAREARAAQAVEPLDVFGEAGIPNLQVYAARL